MKHWPVSSGTPAPTRWLTGGPVDAFRFAPHEFAPRTNFFIRKIKLAALERTIGNTLTFRWTYSEPSGTVSLFRQPAGTAKNFSGGNTIVSNTNAVAGSFTWDTTGVPDGEYQIYATFTDGTNSNQVYAPTNIVVDHANDAVARINLNRTQLSYSITGAVGGGIVQTDPQSVSLTFTGAGSQCWTASSSNGFVTVSPASGNAAARLTIQTTPGANFPGGRADAVVTIQSCTNPANARAIGVAVNVFNFGAPPTGSMDTPAENSVARGSVAVTGWASDDVQVTRVMVCRAPVAGDGAGACPNGTIFIGDATFVDDARPDIEQGNPTNPLNYRGGWGLMILTNFLPNLGNGPITLFAYAVDRDGHVVQIGTRHISTQNSTATVPFGTIDSPKAGEIVCGTQFPNAGWALTQRNKTINAPTQITVFVDGVAVGHPIPGGPRSDITGLFSPTYDTSTASTVFGLDTTRFSNGPHTIFWIVSDSGGQADGIGSRFFTISNPCGS